MGGRSDVGGVRNLGVFVRERWRTGRLERGAEQRRRQLERGAKFECRATLERRSERKRRSELERGRWERGWRSGRGVRSERGRQRESMGMAHVRASRAGAQIDARLDRIARLQ